MTDLPHSAFTVHTPKGETFGPRDVYRMALNFAARADGIRLPEVIETLKAQLA